MDITKRNRHGYVPGTGAVFVATSFEPLIRLNPKTVPVPTARGECLLVVLEKKSHAKAQSTG